MTASATTGLRVVQPGLFTTVQDLGRFGYQNVGVTPSGALDVLGLRLANALVGNPQSAAVLEISYAGPELEVTADAVRVAVCGGDCPIEVHPGPDRRGLPLWRTAHLRRGDRLKIGTIEGATCTYLAVEGGIEVPEVMGSRATYPRATLGGLHGRALVAGDEIQVGETAAVPAADRMLPAPPDYGSGPIRVVLGPQDDHFTAAGLEAFLSGAYEITKESDRMGLRLSGPEIEHRDGYEIASDGIAPGAIQVPGNRQPIVLLADRQTVGGYTKIATVVSADLPRVASAAPGTVLRFKAIDIVGAETLRRALERHVEALLAGIRPAPAVGEPDLRRLEELDLIGGVI
ncbi:MAG: biotin-dependent carboxyltransferase family protein [Alphaproteobacteria bacterium]|nr:biotin-dependent carboxyltransferase family protein [Alphaproteobacteria bacterium]